MPVSKKRKRKGGAVARYRRDRRRREIEENSYGDLSSGVTLQDLINMVAYQEYQEQGKIDGPAIPDNAEADTEIPEGPEAEAIIRAVHKMTTEEENEDGR